MIRNKNNQFIKKVKEVLMKDEFSSHNEISNWGDTSEDGELFKEKYNHHRSENLNFGSIIGAFYDSKDYFYYIEKMEEDYVLTRHIDNYERKTILQKDELKYFYGYKDNDITHTSVIVVATYVDFIKSRMGL